MNYTIFYCTRFFISISLVLFSLCLQANVVIIDVEQTQEICNLSNGTITITAQGDPGVTLFYSIDGGGTWQESNFFDGLASDDYDLLVADGSGSCSEDFSFQVTAADSPQIAITPTCITGIGTIDIDLVPFMSGILPFAFTWTGPAGTYSTEDLSNVPTGQYSVIVQDAFGCQVDTSFFVPVCCALQVNCNSDTTDLKCIDDFVEISTATFDTLNSIEKIIALESDLFIEVLDGACNDITVLISEIEQVDPNCIGPMEVVRSIEISDGISTIVCDKTYLIENYLGLEFQSPAQNIEVSCGDDYQTLFQEFVDNVGGAEIRPCSNQYVVTTDPATPSLDFDCSNDIEITFFITDACGNEDSTTAIFSVVDSIGPSISCPDDLILTFGDDNEIAIAEWITSVVSMDDCSTVSNTNDFDVDNLDETCDGSMLIVLFQATDACSNQADCTASIIYPAIGQLTLLCPQDTTLLCSGTNLEDEVGLWLNLGSATASDGTPLIVNNDFSPEDLESLNCGGSLDVMFEVTSSCGLSTCAASFAVLDDMAPLLDCPGPLLVNYDDLDVETAIEVWLDSGTATDNCSAIQILNNYQSDQLVLDCQGSELLVEFEVEDGCNNNSSCTSLLTVQGGQGGDIICPIDIDVNCGEALYVDILDAWIADANAIDEEMNVLQVSNDLDLPTFEFSSCGDVLEVAFFVNENCIDISCMSTITIVDTEIPVLSCPDNVTLDFSADSFLVDVDDWLAEVGGIDNCSDIDIENNLVLASLIECDDNIINVVDFIASDLCGNSASCSSELTIIAPAGLPSLICPDVLEVGCEEDLELAVMDWMALTAAVDENGSTIVADNDLAMSEIESLTCGEIASVNFSVDGVCGTVDCESSIQIIDDVQPEIVCPSPLVVSEFENIDQTVDDWLESVSGSDSCSPVVTSHNFDFELADETCPEEFEITFVVTDECQNKTSCMSSVSIGAVIGVELSCPSDITIKCMDAEPQALIDNLLRSITVESSAQYDLDYDFSIDINEIGCESVYSFDAIVIVVGDCEQEDDCQIIINVVPEPSVYVPSVFSPNLRNQEVVTVYGNSVIEEVEEFYIYDRWGNLVYEAYGFEPNDDSMGWDGSFNKSKTDSAVYTYYTVVRTIYDSKIKYTGAVTLLH